MCYGHLFHGCYVQLTVSHVVWSKSYNQINQRHGVDRHICRTLHHTLVVMYLQMEGAWRGSGGVIVHTRQDFGHPRDIVYRAAISFDLSE